MAKYRIIKENEKYNVFEVASENVVKTFEKYDDARAHIRKLNNFGFMGWTPAFFLTHIDVDKIFAET